MTAKNITDAIEDLIIKKVGYKDILSIKDKINAYDDAVAYDKIAPQMPWFNNETHLRAIDLLNMELNEAGLNGVKR